MRTNKMLYITFYHTLPQFDVVSYVSLFCWMQRRVHPPYLSYMITYYTFSPCMEDKIHREWCMYSSDELFRCWRQGYFGVYFPSCEATREINTKITLWWVQKQFFTRVHISFYFLHDITNPLMTIKTTILTHRPCVSLARFSSADDVTIDCWWRHNGQTIVTWLRDKWYLTRSISILFTAIFTTGRVRI